MGLFPETYWDEVKEHAKIIEADREKREAEREAERTRLLSLLKDLKRLPNMALLRDALIFLLEGV